MQGDGARPFSLVAAARLGYHPAPRGLLVASRPLILLEKTILEFSHV